MGWFNPSNGIQSTESAPETDPRVQRALIESMLKRANILRANTPIDVNNQENMVSGRYVMPYGRLARMFLDPVLAGVQESGAISKLADLHKAEQANVEKALAGFPRNAEGGINLEDKAGLLKAAVAASQAAETNPVLGHILTQVVKNAIPSQDNPWINIGGAIMPKGGTPADAVIPPAVQAMKDQAKQDKIDTAVEIAKQKAELGLGPKGKDPVAIENTQLRNQKLKAELNKLKEGKPLELKTEGELTAASETIKTAKDLLESFKDDYAGGITKEGELLLGQILGETSKYIDPNAYPLKQWWSNYELFQNIPQRFEKYGASLTQSEKENWKSATVRPSDDSKVIRNKVAYQMELMKNKVEAIRQSQKEGGRNVQQINNILAEFGLVPRLPKATGKDYSGQQVQETDLQPGDTMGGAIWTGSEWVSPHEHTPPIDLGISPKQESKERRFRVIGVK